MPCTAGYAPLIVSSVGGQCKIVELPDGECLCAPICGLTGGNTGGTGGTGSTGTTPFTVTVFQKNTNGSVAPSLPSGSLTSGNEFVFTFATGGLATNGDANLNSWTLAAPSVAAGEYLWATSAYMTTTYPIFTTASFYSNKWVAATVRGSGGPTGPTGTTGPGGMDYNFDPTTTVGDPTPGYVRFSSVTFASIGTVCVDDENGAGKDLVNWLMQLENVTGSVKGVIAFVDTFQQQNYALFNVTGTTDKTSYVEYAVTPLVGSNADVTGIFSLDTPISMFINGVGSGRDDEIESSVPLGWANAGGISNPPGIFKFTGPAPTGSQYLAYFQSNDGGSGGYHHQTPFSMTDQGGDAGLIFGKSGPGSWEEQREDGSTGAAPTTVYVGVTMGCTGTATMQADSLYQGSGYKKVADLDITAIGTGVVPIEGATWSPGGGDFAVDAYSYGIKNVATLYISNGATVIDIGAGGEFIVSGTDAANKALFYIADSDGQVGIGTTGPGQALDVVKHDTGAIGIRVESKGASTASDSRFIAKAAASGGDPHIRFLRQSGQSYCMGISNAASDNLRITDAANLDSNIAVEIDGSQDIWMPQTLAVGQSSAADNAAVLELESTTQVFLPPRMTTSQRDLISPPAGGVIYNTTTNVLNFYNGSAWGAV